jgi:hypothetical protein
MIALDSKRRSFPPVSGLISPWPLIVSNDFTVPKYFMVCSLVGEREMAPAG